METDMQAAPAIAVRVAGFVLAWVTLCASTASLAQGTDRPLKIILPFGPGSGVDVITRTLAPALSKALGGQSVVVENQPGAGGIPGTHAMIKSAPDGHTISLVSNNHVIYPSVYKSLPFDPLADITPISVLGTTPMVLLVNPAKVPARNVSELIAFFKARPGAYNYASSGNGTILHLAAEMFVDEAGVDVKHIPYKGVGPMLADTIGGQVEMSVSALPTIQGHLKSGALRAIGIGSAARSAAAPEIATIAEQGLPKVKGEFAWHTHDNTDDFFLVLKGRITIRLREGDVSLGAGELFVVSKGVEQCPVAEEEAHLLLIEPAGTPNTGNAATAAPRRSI